MTSDKRYVPTRPTKTERNTWALYKDVYIRSASVVLRNNNFQFDSYMFLLLFRTAMGAKFAPPYACLSVGYLEKNYFISTITFIFYIKWT